MVTTDEERAARRKARHEQQESERAAMWLDARTKMPRIVRLTANEARTLDPKPFERQNYCMSCGHLPGFHTIGSHASFCTVVDCDCTTEDLDAREQDDLRAEERLWLYRKAYSPWRWIAPLIGCLVGIAIGATFL
ncbi:MAG TPA: hypothetical protein VIV58_21955 [Kofleriaceae bacterium]